MKNKIPLLLSGIALFGFLLRFFAISHGISYHPDERGIIMMTEALSWENPIPQSFAYGSLPFYLLKGVSEFASFLWPRASSYDGLFITGRLLNALFAVWLINATFRFCLTLFSNRLAAYWAAFLVGTNSFILQNSHFFTVDILLTILGVEALTAMTQIPQKGKWKNYLLAAAIVGAALATKIGALTLLAPAILAFIFHRFQLGENPLPLLCLIGGFFLGISGVSTTIGLTAILIGVPLTWYVPPLFTSIKISPFNSWPSLIYPFVCLAVIVALFSIGEPYAYDWQGWGNLYECYRSDSCSPLTQLFSERFLHDIGGEIAMVRGTTPPRPYTVQYWGTLPYVYPIGQIFSTTMGPFTAILVLSGLLIEAITRPTKIRLIPLFWAFLFFFSVAGSYVKFPRYLLPLYPLLFCYAGNAITLFTSSIIKKIGRSGSYIGLKGQLESSYGWNNKILFVLSAIIAIPILIRSFAFSSIYSVPHPYAIASRWAYENIPAGSTILGVHWDDKLPLDLPGYSSHQFAMWSPNHELAIYEPDEPTKIKKITAQLAQADYLIFPSSKIPASIPRWQEHYHFSSRLLQELFAGNLGFSLEKTIKNYPSLGTWYTINDDVSDESLTLYDHPKVYIFRRVKPFSADQLESTVANAPFLPVEETIERVQRATAGQENGFPAFVPYTLGSMISWIFVIEILAWVVRIPLNSLLGLSKESAAFASRPVGLFLFFGIFWWLNAINVAHADPTSLWITAFAAILARTTFFQAEKSSEKVDQNSTLFFWIPFIIILCLRSFQSEIFWGEKPMDFSFLNYFFREKTLPPTDPWAAGNSMKYYYMGSYLFAQLTKMAAVSPAIGFNLAIATVAASIISALAALLLSITSVRPRVAGFLGSATFFLSNPESVFVWWRYDKVNFDTFWASTRLFRSPAFTEYPLWATIHADLHAHYIAIPLAILVALGISRISTRTQNLVSYLSGRIFLGMMAGFLIATNSWDVITLAILGGSAYLVLTLTRLVTTARKGIPKIFQETILDLTLLSLTVVATSFPFLRDNLFGSTALGSGYVYNEEFNDISHLFRHFGLWLILITLLGGYRFIVNRREGSWWNHLLIIPFVLPAIYLFLDSAVFQKISGVRFSYFTVSIALALLAHQVWSQITLSDPKRAPGFCLSALLLATSFILLFGELRYVGDRMNTIFKFYSPLWWFFGTIAASLFVELVNDRSRNRYLTSRQSITLISWGLLCNLLFLSFTFSVGWLIPLFMVFTLSLGVVVIWVFFVIKSIRTSSLVHIDWSISYWPGIAVALFTLSLCSLGSLLNFFSLTTINRASQPVATLDGTAYLSETFNSDWDISRWLNQNYRGTEAVLEATGDAYQDYSRISMNTGLPTLLGWEHHTNQRGTSRNDITARRRAITDIYSTPSVDLAVDLLKKYKIRFIVIGNIERRLYQFGRFSPEGELKFLNHSERFVPVFGTKSATLYQFID